jgi:protein-S-isoprenylcysteine O-methyltransferase Ste14
VSLTVYSWLIYLCWLIFAAVWAATAFRAKRSIRDVHLRQREIVGRLILVVVVVLLVHFISNGHGLRGLQPYAVIRSPIAGPVGAALCVLGAGIAIAARVYLGRNWGMPMARKENPELVTKGPYAIVRHPIYTGILLILLGSAIGATVAFALPLVVSAPYFVYSARREERLMTEQFPEQYPAYMKQTKMLVPYLL